MMKTDLLSVCSVLARVSVVTTLGAAAVGCSGSDEPAPGTAGAGGGAGADAAVRT
jgi:hypothetical protein